MKKDILIIYGILLMSLLLIGCAFGQLLTSTIPVASPTPDIPVEIKAVTLEPLVLKNGDSFFVRVKAHLGGHPIQVDLSQLDTTQKTLVILGADGQDSYIGKFTISYGNVAMNGKKTITVTTLDGAGKSIVATTQVELQNPAPVLDEISPNDNFDKPHLDSSKWSFDNGNGGKIDFQAGKLLIATGSQYNSQARIYSVWKFSADFDIQVDFQNGEGWVIPETKHTDFAFFGVKVDETQYHITRLMRTQYDRGNNIMMAWSDLENINQEKPVTALSGKIRLIRTGGSLIYLYDIGDGWVQLGMVTLPVSPAQVYMGIQSVYHSQVFSTYFDNFTINSGKTIP